jgi:hypothetical protein
MGKSAVMSDDFAYINEEMKEYVCKILCSPAIRPFLLTSLLSSSQHLSIPDPNLLETTQEPRKKKNKRGK